MRRVSRAVVSVAALFILAGTTPVFAGSPVASDSVNARSHRNTFVIDGREYGPKDGLKVDTFQFELQPGSGSVGVVFGETPNGPGSVIPLGSTYWGTSYAISTEWWSQLGYDGKAKAAANVYNNLRIVEVCIWYTREGAGVVGAKVCSDASSDTGVWLPGPEVTTSAWDSLNPLDPPTVFNISTVRIDPRLLAPAP